MAQQTHPLRTPPEFALDQWTTEHGLPQNSVNAMVLGPDGYLWVGTFGGLARFDGNRFTIDERADSTGRHIDRVLALALAPDSALWIGTETGLLRRKHGKYQVFTRSNGLPDDEVRALMVDRAGTLWIGTKAGGISWLQRGRLHGLQYVGGIRIGEVTQISMDREGTTWINAGDGVLRIRGANAGAITWHTPPASRTAYLLHDQHNAFWFARRGQTLRMPTEDAGGHAVKVSGSIMVADPDTGYWVGTINDGAFFLRPVGRELHAQHYPLPDGRGTYRVRSLLADNDGNVWIGTNASGLLRARRNVFTTYTSAHGLSHDVATAVFADRTGTIWVGTNCGGVNAIDPARRTVSVFNPRSPQDPAGDPCVFALTEDRESMWQGTYGGGVTALPAIAHRSRVPVTGLTDPEVLALFTDRDGVMWVGTRNGGLARVENRRVQTIYTTAHGLAHNSVRYIYQTRDGALWIGTIDGLSRLSNGRFTNYTATDGLSSTHIRAIHEDAAGTLWIGTYGGGLNRFRNGAFVAITERAGLSGDVVSSILEDDYGNFWMSGNRGIQRVATDQLNAFADGAIKRVHSVLYARADGLLNPETNGGFQPAAYRDARGHFWFPTVNGAAVVDPARVRRNLRAPSVVLEEVMVDGVVNRAQTGIEVGRGRPNLEFRYAGISLAAPEHMRFRYRLEGYDEEWVEAGTRNVAYYPRLPAGRYRFIVHAANRDGEWSARAANLDLRVLPAVWQTWWFRVFALVSIAGMVFAWSRRRSALAQARHDAQQAFARQLIASQEQERRRLASELHDGLGQDLLIARNRVLLALRANGADARVREQLDQIGELVSSSLASIRELAHNLTPHQLEHLGITSALRTMVETVADAAGITIDSVIEEIDGLLPTESEINLYRVVQEALNNIVHHAQSATATLYVRHEGYAVHVTITDFGRGFHLPRDRHAIAHAGFGLSSMAERARMVGGTLTIESEPNAGTRIALSIPVAREAVRRTHATEPPKVNA